MGRTRALVQRFRKFSGKRRAETYQPVKYFSRRVLQERTGHCKISRKVEQTGADPLPQARRLLSSGEGEALLCCRSLRSIN
jgi:hypothetical protein